MYFWLAGAVLAFYFVTRNRLPSYLSVDKEGDLVFMKTPEAEKIHATLLTYGRQSEGSLSDGTMWVEGTLGTGKPAGDSDYASNIYARALQLGGPTEAELRWILASRADLAAIAEGKPPARLRLHIVDPAFVRASGMIKPGQTLVYYG